MVAFTRAICRPGPVSGKSITIHANEIVQMEVLPPALDSTSESPCIFDGATRGVGTARKDRYGIN
ncbi:hypothetical protein C5167_019401 [Papaver somniferum]|uniref:Uncharacterized protein n=1 Tax=Papaver somniferum TaxID=3469 RepID=A0A4Y7IQL8_PAPSO|nr:hypothetical protein C5167_019401 [Papaver somniferum]